MAFFPRGPPRGMFFGGNGQVRRPFPIDGMHRPMRPFAGRPGPFRSHRPFPPGIIPHGPPPFQRFVRPGGPPRGAFYQDHRPKLLHQHPRHSNPCSPGGNNANRKQEKRKQNKPKVDKRDLAENNAFYCDICDKGFKTKEGYDIHIGAHQKCKVEGCPYTAAPKLVQLHYNLQHKTGLAKKIWKFESPEDVAKWRAERKKNFPTAATVAKKEADKAEKIARGEVLQDKFFGKFGKHNRGFGRGRGRGCGNHHFQDTRNIMPSHNAQKRLHDNSSENQTTSPKKQKVSVHSSGMKQLTEDSTASEVHTGDPLSLLLLDGTGGSDEEADKTEQVTRADRPISSTQSNPLAAGGLGSLMCSYGSDAENDEEDSTSGRTPAADKDKAPGSDDDVVDAQDRAAGNHKRQRRKRGRKGKQNETDNSQCSQKSTLLEKLLAPEIRHERNVILQCVRYIVKNNFFELAKNIDKKGSSQQGKPLSAITDADEEIWEDGL
ncbi:FMR1-interacting protein NUFIP1-like [Liolophura sinensis]|uniref:FMR1-interacting protein NUFIP1-like n=1 Tax=Liolophura sinensis TaxID=3198878 RepID=UPI003158A2AC